MTPLNNGVPRSRLSLTESVNPTFLPLITLHFAWHSIFLPHSFINRPYVTYQRRTELNMVGNVETWCHTVTQGRGSEWETGEWSGYPVLFTLPGNMVYPALLQLMCTTRLPSVDWTDAPCRFKWTRPFGRKTKSGFCACAITFQTHANRAKGLTCALFKPS